MTIPVGFVYMLGLTVVVFSAVVVQHAGIRLLHQDVFHAGICPQELPITGFVRMPDFSAAPFSPELRRCLSPRSIKPPGDLFLPTTLQVQRIDEPSEEIQRKRLERVANEISARSETVKDVPLDLFHPSEAALEKGDAFYYEMLRAIGPTKDAWRDYKKYIRRYETYLHDIRAFNGTIRNFISFSLSKLKHNSPEDYAAALYGFYNDERIAEKLIVNPIRNNGDCYTTHDAYELSYVPRPLVLADAGYDLRLLRRTGAGAGWKDLPGDRSHQQLPQQGAEQRCLEGTSAGLQKKFCPYPKGTVSKGVFEV